MKNKHKIWLLIILLIAIVAVVGFSSISSKTPPIQINNNTTEKVSPATNTYYPEKNTESQNPQTKTPETPITCSTDNNPPEKNSTTNSYE